MGYFESGSCCIAIFVLIFLTSILRFIESVFKVIFKFDYNRFIYKDKVDILVNIQEDLIINNLMVLINISAYTSYAFLTVIFYLNVVFVVVKNLLLKDHPKIKLFNGINLSFNFIYFLNAVIVNMVKL